MSVDIHHTMTEASEAEQHKRGVRRAALAAYIGCGTRLLPLPMGTAAARVFPKIFFLTGDPSLTAISVLRHLGCRVWRPPLLATALVGASPDWSPAAWIVPSHPSSPALWARAADKMSPEDLGNPITELDRRHAHV